MTFAPIDLSIWDEAINVWLNGGWLMLPLFFLTVFIYYTAMELLIRLNSNFLIRTRVHRLSDNDIGIGLNSKFQQLKGLLLENPRTIDEVRRHFEEVQQEYLPIINRRIRSLSIIITTGPLIGLLGTVTGMLSTFEGMASLSSNKFESVVSGISEALITTQAGLVISIPAFIILSLIIQRRNTLKHCIARLERYNTLIALNLSRKTIKEGS